jgi:hypothetical protein
VDHLPDGKPFLDATNGQEVVHGLVVAPVFRINDKRLRIEDGEGVNEVGNPGDVELTRVDFVAVLLAPIPVVCKRLLYVRGTVDLMNLPAPIVRNAPLDSVAAGTCGRQLIALATVTRLIVGHLHLGATESLGGATEVQ